MRNPLWKRLPRELKSDFGKYIVIFLFMTLTIGFVSGFLVADDSMLAAYDESFEKYNIEHGNFTLSSEASESTIKKIEEKGDVRLCKNFYRGPSRWIRIWMERKTEPSEFTRTVRIWTLYA